MATQEQGNAPSGDAVRQLVFDEKREKWKMTNSRSGHQRGQPISPDHAQKRDKGLKQYRQKQRMP